MHIYYRFLFLAIFCYIPTVEGGILGSCKIRDRYKLSDLDNEMKMTTFLDANMQMFFPPGLLIPDSIAPGFNVGVSLAGVNNASTDTIYGDMELSSIFACVYNRVLARGYIGIEGRKTIGGIGTSISDAHQFIIGLNICHAVDSSRCTGIYVGAQCMSPIKTKEVSSEEGFEWDLNKRYIFRGDIYDIFELENSGRDMVSPDAFGLNVGISSSRGINLEFGYVVFIGPALFVDNVYESVMYAHVSASIRNGFSCSFGVRTEDMERFYVDLSVSISLRGLLNMWSNTAPDKDILASLMVQPIERHVGFKLVQRELKSAVLKTDTTPYRFIELFQASGWQKVLGLAKDDDIILLHDGFVLVSGNAVIDKDISIVGEFNGEDIYGNKISLGEHRLVYLASSLVVSDQARLKISGLDLSAPLDGSNVFKVIKTVEANVATATEEIWEDEEFDPAFIYFDNGKIVMNNSGEFVSLEDDVQLIFGSDFVVERTADLEVDISGINNYGGFILDGKRVGIIKDRLTQGMIDYFDTIILNGTAYISEPLVINHNLVIGDGVNAGELSGLKINGSTASSIVCTTEMNAFFELMDSIKLEVYGVKLIGSPTYLFTSMNPDVHVEVRITDAVFQHDTYPVYMNGTASVTLNNFDFDIVSGSSENILEVLTRDLFIAGDVEIQQVIEVQGDISIVGVSGNYTITNDIYAESAFSIKSISVVTDIQDNMPRITSADNDGMFFLHDGSTLTIKNLLIADHQGTFIRVSNNASSFDIKLEDVEFEADFNIFINGIGDIEFTDVTTVHLLPADFDVQNLSGEYIVSERISVPDTILIKEDVIFYGGLVKYQEIPQNRGDVICRITKARGGELISASDPMFIVYPGANLTCRSLFMNTRYTFLEIPYSDVISTIDLADASFASKKIYIKTDSMSRFLLQDNKTVSGIDDVLTSTSIFIPHDITIDKVIAVIEPMVFTSSFIDEAAVVTEDYEYYMSGLSNIAPTVTFTANGYLDMYASANTLVMRKLSIKVEDIEEPFIIVREDHDLFRIELDVLFNQYGTRISTASNGVLLLPNDNEIRCVSSQDVWDSLAFLDNTKIVANSVWEIPDRSVYFSGNTQIKSEILGGWILFPFIDAYNTEMAVSVKSFGRGGFRFSSASDMFVIEESDIIVLMDGVSISNTGGGNTFVFPEGVTNSLMNAETAIITQDINVEMNEYDNGVYLPDLRYWQYPSSEIIIGHGAFISGEGTTIILSEDAYISETDYIAGDVRIKGNRASSGILFGGRFYMQLSGNIFVDASQIEDVGIYLAEGVDPNTPVFKLGAGSTLTLSNLKLGANLIVAEFDFNNNEPSVLSLASSDLTLLGDITLKFGRGYYHVILPESVSLEMAYNTLPDDIPETLYINGEIIVSEPLRIEKETLFKMLPDQVPFSDGGQKVFLTHVKEPTPSIHFRVLYEGPAIEIINTNVLFEVPMQQSFSDSVLFHIESSDVEIAELYAGEWIIDVFGTGQVSAIGETVAYSNESLSDTSKHMLIVGGPITWSRAYRATSDYPVKYISGRDFRFSQELTSGGIVYTTIKSSSDEPRIVNFLANNTFICDANTSIYIKDLEISCISEVFRSAGDDFNFSLERVRLSDNSAVSVYPLHKGGTLFIEGEYIFGLKDQTSFNDCSVYIAYNVEAFDPVHAIAFSGDVFYGVPKPVHVYESDRLYDVVYGTFETRNIQFCVLSGATSHIRIGTICRMLGSIDDASALIKVESGAILDLTVDDDVFPSLSRWDIYGNCMIQNRERPSARTIYIGYTPTELSGYTVVVRPISVYGLDISPQTFFGLVSKSYFEEYDNPLGIARMRINSDSDASPTVTMKGSINTIRLRSTASLLLYDIVLSQYNASDNIHLACDTGAQLEIISLRTASSLEWQSGFLVTGVSISIDGEYVYPFGAATSSGDIFLGDWVPGSSTEVTYDAGFDDDIIVPRGINFTKASKITVAGSLRIRAAESSDEMVVEENDEPRTFPLYPENISTFPGELIIDVPSTDSDSRAVISFVNPDGLPYIVIMKQGGTLSVEDVTFDCNSRIEKLIRTERRTDSIVYTSETEADKIKVSFTNVELLNGPNSWTIDVRGTGFIGFFDKDIWIFSHAVMTDTECLEKMDRFEQDHLLMLDQVPLVRDLCVLSKDITIYAVNEGKPVLSFYNNGSMMNVSNIVFDDVLNGQSITLFLEYSFPDLPNKSGLMRNSSADQPTYIVFPNSGTVNFHNTWLSRSADIQVKLTSDHRDPGESVCVRYFKHPNPEEGRLMDVIFGLDTSLIVGNINLFAVFFYMGPVSASWRFGNLLQFIDDLIPSTDIEPAGSFRLSNVLSSLLWSSTFSPYTDGHVICIVDLDDFVGDLKIYPILLDETKPCDYFDVRVLFWEIYGFDFLTIDNADLAYVWGGEESDVLNNRIVDVRFESCNFSRVPKLTCIGFPTCDTLLYFKPAIDDVYGPARVFLSKTDTTTVSSREWVFLDRYHYINVYSSPREDYAVRVPLSSHQEQALNLFFSGNPDLDRIEVPNTFEAMEIILQRTSTSSFPAPCLLACIGQLSMRQSTERDFFIKINEAPYVVLFDGLDVINPDTSSRELPLVDYSFQYAGCLGVVADGLHHYLFRASNAIDEGGEGLFGVILNFMIDNNRINNIPDNAATLFLQPLGDRVLIEDIEHYGSLIMSVGDRTGIPSVVCTQPMDFDDWFSVSLNYNALEYSADTMHVIKNGSPANNLIELDGGVCFIDVPRIYYRNIASTMRLIKVKKGDADSHSSIFMRTSIPDDRPNIYLIDLEGNGFVYTIDMDVPGVSTPYNDERYIGFLYNNVGSVYKDISDINCFHLTIGWGNLNSLPSEPVRINPSKLLNLNIGETSVIYDRLYVIGAEESTPKIDRQKQEGIPMFVIHGEALEQYTEEISAEILLDQELLQVLHESGMKFLEIRDSTGDRNRSLSIEFSWAYGASKHSIEFGELWIDMEPLRRVRMSFPTGDRFTNVTAVEANLPSRSERDAEIDGYNMILITEEWPHTFVVEGVHGISKVLMVGDKIRAQLSNFMLDLDVNINVLNSEREWFISSIQRFDVDALSFRYDVTTIDGSDDNNRSVFFIPSGTRTCRGLVYSSIMISDQNLIRSASPDVSIETLDLRGLRPRVSGTYSTSNHITSTTAFGYYIGLFGVGSARILMKHELTSKEVIGYIIDGDRTNSIPYGIDFAIIRKRIDLSSPIIVPYGKNLTITGRTMPHHIIPELNDLTNQIWTETLRGRSISSILTTPRVGVLDTNGSGVFLFCNNRKDQSWHYTSAPTLCFHGVSPVCIQFEAGESYDPDTVTRLHLFEVALLIAEGLFVESMRMYSASNEAYIYRILSHEYPLLVSAGRKGGRIECVFEDILETIPPYVGPPYGGWRAWTDAIGFIHPDLSWTTRIIDNKGYEPDAANGTNRSVYRFINWLRHQEPENTSSGTQFPRTAATPIYKDFYVYSGGDTISHSFPCKDGDGSDFNFRITRFPSSDDVAWRSEVSLVTFARVYSLARWDDMFSTSAYNDDVLEPSIFTRGPTIVTTTTRDRNEAGAYLYYVGMYLPSEDFPVNDDGSLATDPPTLTGNIDVPGGTFAISSNPNPQRETFSRFYKRSYTESGLNPANLWIGTAPDERMLPFLDSSWWVTKAEYSNERNPRFAVYSDSNVFRLCSMEMYRDGFFDKASPNVWFKTIEEIESPDGFHPFSIYEAARRDLFFGAVAS